jgi:PST family polysaccharide transporter
MNNAIEEQSTYGRILKSSLVMGGAAAINMIFGFVRTKFAAMLLGPTGIGELANLTAILNLISTIAGFGMQNSGVRSIAQANSNGSQDSLGYTALTLRRVCLVTGLVGSIVTIMMSTWFSKWTFGSDNMTLHIAALSVGVLLGNLSSGQVALLQGLRQIKDLAKINVYGGAIGTAASIFFYFWLGHNGIVPTLLVTVAATAAVSWLISKRIDIPKIQSSWNESLKASRSMLAFGISLMWAAVVTSLVGYLINAIITKELGITSVGIYSAAFTLSAVLVSFVLNAMGSDYYPRLVAAAGDHTSLNRFVNEQTEIGILLATPFLLATLTFSPWVVQFFYSAEFLPAAGLMQWFVLGSLIRVIQWPMGYLQQALGKAKIFIITQTFFNILHLALFAFFLREFGLEGAAASFFALYAIALGVIKKLANHLTTFMWSSQATKLIATNALLILLVFMLMRWLPLLPGTIAGTLITTFATTLSIRGLTKRVGPEHRLVKLFMCIPLLRLFLRVK